MKGGNYGGRSRIAEGWLVKIEILREGIVGRDDQVACKHTAPIHTPIDREKERGGWMGCICFRGRS